MTGSMSKLRHGAGRGSLILATSVQRYWHTLRYLKPVQFYGRLWFGLRRPLLDSGARAPGLRTLTGPWRQPAARLSAMLGPDRFRFLNQEHRLPAHNGWNDAAMEKLWLYNLHYFDDLNAADATSRLSMHLALMQRWVDENPPTVGNGWEPYPTSLRIVNWIKWALAGHALPAVCVHSLALQARWLVRRLEIHLLGNHLFANAKALVFAGLYFDGAEAESWLQLGLRILAREVPEQILPDGGHFERSTMYHALALEDMLDLCNVTTTFASAIPADWQVVVAGWHDRIVPMCDWLGTMCHPDGEISLFNDAAIGIAPSPAELFRYAPALGFAQRPSPSVCESVTHLAASGYVRMEHGPLVALLDVAPVGPDYLPGHAHADTLSFELSAFGQRVLVNSGTSCYGLSAERLRQRGTAAHNTVVVDGEDSSEVWAGFRVARRARPVGLELVQEGQILVRCSHGGYHRLPGMPTHVRTWLLDEGAFVVDDRVVGRHGEADARFHIHPAVVVESLVGGTTGRLVLGNGRGLTWRVEDGVLALAESTYHPCFGVSQPNRCLVLRLQDGHSRIRFEWT